MPLNNIQLIQNLPELARQLRINLVIPTKLFSPTDSALIISLRRTMNIQMSLSRSNCNNMILHTSLLVKLTLFSASLSTSRLSSARILFGFLSYINLQVNRQAFHVHNPQCTQHLLGPFKTQLTRSDADLEGEPSPGDNLLHLTDQLLHMLYIVTRLSSLLLAMMQHAASGWFVITLDMFCQTH